jgi:predicted lipid-binding transport protein (Tim44 family)
MNKFLVTALLVAAATALAPLTADAKRLGGGSSSGMQRNMPAKSAPDALPAKPAAPAAAATPAAAGAAAAAPKRNWMGPLAGLAAGLGIAALMSHLGMGAAFGNFLTMALLAVAAFFVIRFLMKRFGGGFGGGLGGGQKPALAGMGAAGGMGAFQHAPGSANDIAARNNMLRTTEPTSGVTAFQNPTPASFDSGLNAAAPVNAATRNHVPADFDSPGFERIAKMIFIRMQTANDAGDLNDLRNFTTPEMFASVRLELQERGPAKQETDVVSVEAQVLDVATEADRQIVSVRFHGMIREEKDAVAAPFDEVWHLVKPQDDSRSWAIAGIEQSH